MKRNILYTFIIATAMSMSGCSSFLEENPVDQMPEEEAYKNPQMIYLNTVANLYTKIGADGGGAGLAGTDRGLYDLNTFTADEAILPTRGGDWDDGGLWRNLFTHNWGTNNDLIIGTWDYLYGVIVQCNQSIDKLVSLKEQDPENEYYEIYRSEVRAIRAMYYYYLLDMFARVPIVESSLTQMADVKQSERTDVFNFVKKELEESIPLLEDAKSAENGEFYGRMTKAAAYFLMAKLALNAEVYTDNDWTDNVRPDGKNIKFTVDGQEVINSDTGEPLEYKPMAVKLQFDKGDTNMKTAGARMYKYADDATATEDGQCPHNDWVLFRYSDVVLMRAEALVRNGQSGQADLDEVRNRVGASFAEATLDNLLKERLLELAWEGWRRQDLVRFGRFNDAITYRPKTEKYLQVFPIHANTLAVNKNLTQNPGYAK